MYWVADAQGRVLGPTQLQTLRELVGSGRLQEISRVSRDGTNWVDADTVPEIVQLRASRTPEAIAALQREQLRKVREYLARVQSQPTHEVFGVRESASLADYRAGFFTTVKRFYPDRQPEGELRQACESVFLHLAGRMVSLERPKAAPPLAAAPPPEPARPPPRLRSVALTPSPPPRLIRGGRDALTYEPAEFMGLKWANERVEARLRIQRKHVPMFTDHPLANFNCNSVFVPGTQIVPLGTLVELLLQFELPDAEIQTRGKVFWENTGGDPRQPAGFGVRLFTLAPQDQAFIRAYIRGG